MSEQLHLICLDLDNTLWETEHTLRCADERLSQWLRERFPEHAEELDSASLREQRIALSRCRPQLRHQLSRLRQLSLRRLLRHFGRTRQQSRLEAAAAFGVFLELRHQLRLYDGAEPVLEQLARHYRLAALSNGNAELWRLPCSRHFDFALRAEELPHGKPHRTAFEAVRRRAGLEAHQIVHIGDSPEDDIQGALQAGCHAIWANFDGMAWRFGTPRPDGEIRHWRELPRLIEALSPARR